jgi:Ca-activated chloride channel family protein
MNLRLSFALSAAILLFAAPAGFAQEAEVTPSEDEAVQDDSGAYDDASIVVTGARVRQGGAQDARHFRQSAELGMPRPESLTIEGLMGEHDLTIPASRPCAQLFCLATEAMIASLPLRPDDKVFVGLGFASNIVAETWQREPLHLVAVVDKSGSMAGEPLDLVRKSLRQIVEQMRDGDRISIVLYGDTSHLFLPPTDIGRDRATALGAIGRIESNGSTNMEAGLRVGYDTAFAAKPAFRGNTRLMLFTDEQPNVGNTDPESFMGMAQAASQAGIGLTTIGVGIQFDGALATDISSVRGGNLFFVANEAEVKSVFAKQLDTMVSEVAHDVRITMTPREGYKVSGVFGVPDGLMRDSEGGAVTITVPTAFLSTNGGGIFVSLGKAADRAALPAAALTSDIPLMDVALSYVGAKDGKDGADRVTVGNPTGVPSQALRLAHLLTDEYFVLHGAATAFHVEDKPKEAFALLSGFSQRLGSSGIAKLGDEKKLVREMLAQAAFHSGYGGEQPAPLAVRGTWEVYRASGVDDVHRGDRLEFGEGDELVTIRRGKDEEYGAYKVNREQIFFADDDEVFDYSIKGDTLTLVHESGAAKLHLRRVPAESDS